MANRLLAAQSRAARKTIRHGNCPRAKVSSGGGGRMVSTSGQGAAPTASTRLGSARVTEVGTCPASSVQVLVHVTSFACGAHTLRPERHGAVPGGVKRASSVNPR